MKKLLLISLLIGAMPLGMAAQDDLYFVSKKKSVESTTDKYGLPRDTYYSGSDRSVDEYNRRSSHYELIDTTKSDVIDFNGEVGVYPDSLGGEDYKLTKKMSRFDEYDISRNEAFWAGYNAGRYDWAWSSPWYYSRYGWYSSWYSPWYYDVWYDPWYYRGWYDPWYAGWYGPWYGGWRYPYVYNTYYVGGRYYANNHTGTIRHSSSNGRVYGRGNAGYSRNGRVGSSRLGSLANRSVSGHSSYNRSDGGTRTVSGHSTYSRSTSAPSVSRSTSSFGGGFSGGGSRGGGGFGGGGGRSGGHAGGRR